MNLKPELLSLSMSAEAVSELAHLAACGNLKDPARLQAAMEAYETVASGYLGLPTFSDVIRANAERFEDDLVRSAFERLAQLVENEKGEKFCRNDAR